MSVIITLSSVAIIERREGAERGTKGKDWASPPLKLFVTYPLVFQMSLILLHSSHLCWLCTLRLQAPLVQGRPSTRGWEFLFVCLHTSSQYKNYLYYCPRPPLCHWSRQCTCSSDLFAYHKPGFLQLGKIMIILMNLLLLMIYDDIWFRLNCNQAFTNPTPLGIFFWISLWHHVSRDHMVSTLINSTPRKKDSQKYFSNF